MKHISVTYSPVSKSWETMIDGDQCRSVAYRGAKRDCLHKAIQLHHEKNQPLFVFDRDGFNPVKLLP